MDAMSVFTYLLLSVQYGEIGNSDYIVDNIEKAILVTILSE
jgi:hypothetical protein